MNLAHGNTPISCFLQHGPSGCFGLAKSHPDGGECDVLMGVDNGREVNFPRFYLLFEHRSYSMPQVSHSLQLYEIVWTNSSGFAGSIITASFDLSSITR
jgi:hypothetical protein